MSLSVQIINTEDCIPLRSLVLRPGQPIANCAFPEDHFLTSFHLGVLNEENRIISVGSFLKNSYPQFLWAKNPYQLRGMATHPDARGRGAGAKLLKKAEAIIQERGGDLLWFNAREKAFPFYEKSSYLDVDGKITVSEYGPHKVMYKDLR